MMVLDDTMKNEIVNAHLFHDAVTCAKKTLSGQFIGYQLYVWFVVILALLI
jgi:hypothetical protein